MKKWISILLALVMVLALCACGEEAAPTLETNAATSDNNVEVEAVDESAPEISAVDWLNEPITVIDNERIKIDLVDYDPDYSMGLLFTMCVTKKTSEEFSGIDCVIDDCTMILMSNQGVYADKASCHEMMYSDSMEYKQSWGSYYDHMAQGEQGYIALLVPIDTIKSSSISQPQNARFYVTWNDYTADTYTVDKSDDISIPQDYEAIEFPGDNQNVQPVVLFEDDNYSAKIVAVKQNTDVGDYKFVRGSNNGNLGTTFVVCYENKTEHGTNFTVRLQEMDGQPAEAELFCPYYFFGVGGGRSCANTKVYVMYLFYSPEESIAIYEGESPSKISIQVSAVEARGETCATEFFGEMIDYNFEADFS